MTHTFDYLLDKIEAAPFNDAPFRHIEINDLFSPEHFEAIISEPQIRLPVATDDRDLLKTMDESGYRLIYFPGTTGDIERYLEWHASKSGAIDNSDTCETFGVVMRLDKFNENSILPELNDFFRSPEFLGCAAAKFGISMDAVSADAGIQKYLDGYEISPHPDTRRKALTWMTNINPAPNSEALDIHTHYMTFRPEFSYVRDFWASHDEIDRAWVPWSWCETMKRQPQNNSLVMFSPSNDTLHAVKAAYDHLPTQRTQLYGNLWFENPPVRERMDWRGLMARNPVAEMV
jgi:hypothetical protein